MASAKPSPFDRRIAAAWDPQELLRVSKVRNVQLVKIYLKQTEQGNGNLKAVISTAPELALLDKLEKSDADRAGGKCARACMGFLF